MKKLTTKEQLAAALKEIAALDELVASLEQDLSYYRCRVTELKGRIANHDDEWSA